MYTRNTHATCMLKFLLCSLYWCCPIIEVAWCPDFHIRKWGTYPACMRSASSQVSIKDFSVNFPAQNYPKYPEDPVKTLLVPNYSSCTVVYLYSLGCPSALSEIGFIQFSLPCPTQSVSDLDIQILWRRRSTHSSGSHFKHNCIDGRYPFNFIWWSTRPSLVCACAALDNSLVEQLEGMNMEGMNMRKLGLNSTLNYRSMIIHINYHINS